MDPRETHEPIKSNDDAVVGDEPLGAGFDFADPHSPLARYYLRTADVIGVLLLAAIVLFFSILPLWHSDIWGHVQFGDWILNHRELPKTEPFTPYADPEVKAPPTQWLTQTAYAALIRLGNRFGAQDGDPQQSLARSVECLRSFQLVICAGLFFFHWLACRRISGSAAWANLALALMFIGISGPAAVQRPQMLGLFCFALLLFILSRAEMSRASLFGLPVLFMTWANLHGTFVVGLAYLCSATVARIVQNRLSTGATNWRAIFRDASVRRMTAACLLCAAAAALNPIGPSLYVEVLAFAGRPNVRDLDEWQPLVFRLRPGGHWAFMASWAAVLVCWALSGWVGTPRLLCMAPFGVWPLFQERALLWWLMLAPWLIASLGPFIGARFSFFRRMPTSVPSFRKTLLAVALVFPVLLWSPPIQWLITGMPRPLEQTLSAATPWRLGLEWQARADQRGRWLPAWPEALRSYPDGKFRGAIFGSETQGDYLLRVAPAGSPVLIYSHAHFFAPAFWRQCMDVKKANGAWSDWLAQHQVNLLVFEPTYYPKLAEKVHQDAAWQVLIDEGNVAGRSRGNTLFIAVRRKPL